VGQVLSFHNEGCKEDEGEIIYQGRYCRESVRELLS